MDAIEVMLRRASPAQLVEPGPNPEQLNKLFAAAVTAPDHGLLQPWRFVVVAGESRRKLGDLMAQSLASREPGASPERLEAERKKALRAPTLLVVAAATQDHPKVPVIEQVVAVGAAVQNLIIAAHALGLGALWRTGPIAYDPEFKKSLGLAESDQIVGIIYLGTVGVPGKQRPHQIESVVRNW